MCSSSSGSERDTCDGQGASRKAAHQRADPAEGERLPLLHRRPPGVADDEVDVLPGGPILLSKVIRIGFRTPYGGAPVTGLTNLLYEVNASRDTFSL